MSKKGFTLIELLAVIVILAIIALIAVPIVLNIVNDSKNQANSRSIELYEKALSNAIAQYYLNDPTAESLTGEYTYTQLDSKLYEKGIKIEYDGSRVECERIGIYGKNSVYMSGCTVNGSDALIDKVYGILPICELVDGNSQDIGSKYTCHLDEDRTFYVLDNTDSSDIVLIMSENFSDEDYPSGANWCDPNGDNPNNTVCNHDGLDPYVDHIQEKFKTDVKVGIPSYEQILAISDRDDLSDWLFDYLFFATHSVDDKMGYWTSTPSSSTNAWWIYYGGIGTAGVNLPFDIRPTITLSKASVN